MEAKKTLVDLERESRDVVAQITSMGGELTPEMEQALEAAELALCHKVDSYSVVLARLEAEEFFWKAQEQKCAAARKAYQSSQARLRDRMRYVLMGNPDKALQGELSRFFLSRTAPKLEINEAELADTFKKTKIQIVPDTDKIEAELKAGRIVPGAVLVENFSLREGRPKK